MFASHTTGRSLHDTSKSGDDAQENRGRENGESRFCRRRCCSRGKHETFFIWSLQHKLTIDKWKKAPLTERWSPVSVPTIKKTRRPPQTRKTDMWLSAGVSDCLFHLSFEKELFLVQHLIWCPAMPRTKNTSGLVFSQLGSLVKNLKGRKSSQPGKKIKD